MLGGESVAGFDEDFSYDPIGNRVATTNYDGTGAAVVSEYAANSLNQYTSRTVPGVAAARGFADANATVTVNENPTWQLGEYFYGSDAFDNSAAPVDAALVTTAALASPTNGPDEVASVTSRVHIAKSPQHFEYDDDGNQTLVTTKTGTWRVTYNGENRPVCWERLNSSTPNSITPNSNTPSLITMTFDHQGRRRMYLETAADGSTNSLDRFTYDNYLCIARNRWSPNGTSATDSFVWDPTEPVATRPLAFYQPNASLQLYSIDGNKNVSELVSSDDGTIFAHYEYAPFGEVILSFGDFALANPFRFSSEYADDTLALVYYNYRHYEPVTGRWLQRDPIYEDGGQNLMAIKNDCINTYDCLGQKDQLSDKYIVDLVKKPTGEFVVKLVQITEENKWKRQIGLNSLRKLFSSIDCTYFKNANTSQGTMKIPPGLVDKFSKFSKPGDEFGISYFQGVRSAVYMFDALWSIHKEPSRYNKLIDALVAYTADKSAESCINLCDELGGYFSDLTGPMAGVVKYSTSLHCLTECTNADCIECNGR